LPKIINGILYCTQTDSSSAQNYARIDSSIYVSKDGTKTVFFILDQTIKSSSAINLNVIKQGSSPTVSASSAGDSSSNLQGASLQSGNFLSIYDPNPSNNLYILNMTDQLKNLVTDNNLLFPNTVYGATAS
jgi:hypothetical protein